MQIKVDHISKTIKGNKVINNISVELESGNVYGIVGRNGSGKTMFFRALSGLISIDSGSIWVDNDQLHKDIQILPNLGIMIENAGLYPELTGFENLKKLAEINKKIQDTDIHQAILRVGLDPTDKRSFRKYSLGMKQRIVLAQAIMEKPDILLLDEPTNALDEEGVQEIRKIIVQEKNRGALIIIASHNKEDIRMLADKVFYMKDGNLCQLEEGVK